MFHLPKNVIRLIFSFDNTYHNVYKKQIVPNIFCKTCMICECYKPSTWYFEIYYNDLLIKEMLVCGTCLVYNNKRIKKYTKIYNHIVLFLEFIRLWLIYII